jgi:CDP-paratose 2-epimerase
VAEPTSPKPHVLVTGGAGFVGSHVAASYLADGHPVTLLDNLVRAGSEHHLGSLRQIEHGRLTVVEADVRDFEAVAQTARAADLIFHFAAQVAVTNSVEDPRADFETNALGTLNVLEAARLGGRRPTVLFASTNKVYGRMAETPTVEGPTRHQYRDLAEGVSERQPIDFHSPYGCSKGAADQYVRDYARIYDLPTVCFRMSCIYGPRQFGTEDQGWVAHFLIAALLDRPLTIYGDGKQVRDILFIDDLVRAFRLAAEKIEVTAGEIFNIGGGSANALSVWEELGPLLAELKGGPVPVTQGPWRPGDQPCYVSDIRKAERTLGWRPLVGKDEGIRRLWEWIAANREIFEPSPRRWALSDSLD